jgi:hypothetical protein
MSLRQERETTPKTRASSGRTTCQATMTLDNNFSGTQEEQGLR